MSSPPSASQPNVPTAAETGSAEMPPQKLKKNHGPGFIVTSRPGADGNAEWVHVDPRAPFTTSPTSAHPQRFEESPEVMLAPLETPTKSSHQHSAPRSPVEDNHKTAVVDTDRIKVSVDAQGRRMVNQYVRLGMIGKGTHGRVWLCEELDSSTGRHVGHYAMKEVYREDQSRNLKKAQRAMHGSTSNFANAFGHHSNPSGPQDLSPKSSPAMQDAHSQAAGSSSQMPSAESSASTTPGTGDASALSQGKPSSSSQSKGKSAKMQMEEKVRQEIAIMKRCTHKHIVQLKEVIDDPKSKKIFMVLEYLAGGQVEYTSSPYEAQPTMTVNEARATIRDVVLGVEYLHYQGIIHRDIKPANLLWTDDSHTCLKITDFGVSHLSEALVRDGQTSPTEGALKKTAGSPAFFAPELCFSAEASPSVTPHNSSTPVERPTNAAGIDMSTYFGYVGPYDESPRPSTTGYFAPPPESEAIRPGPRPNRHTKGISSGTITTISHPLAAPMSSPLPGGTKRTPPPIGKAIDIWAVGVTLYCLLFGKTPFTAETEYMLYNIIPYAKAPIPEHMGSDHVPMDSEEGQEVIDLLGRLLEKDPTRRISLAEVKTHPWILRNLIEPEEWVMSTDPRAAPAVTVTSEEVQQATVARLSTRSFMQARLRSSLKRTLAKFGHVVGMSSAKPRTSSYSSGSGGAESRARSLASRQASGSSSHGGRPSSPSGASESSRVWSFKRKASNSASVPVTPLAPPPDLQRSVSTSSSNSNSPSIPSFSRRPSGNSVPPSTSGSVPPGVPMPIALRRANSQAEGSPQSSYPPGWAGSSDTDSRLSIKGVWDRLKAVGKSPGPNTGRHDRPVSPEVRPRQRSDDTDASVDSRSMTGSARESFDSGVSASRNDFDQFGRRQRTYDEEEEDLSDNDEELMSEFDSDSSLGEPIEGNFSYNDGRGWMHGLPIKDPAEPCNDAHSTPRSSAREMVSRQASAEDELQDEEPSPGDPAQAHPENVPSGSKSKPKPPSIPSDVEVDDDEAAALELNFGRRRRQTNPTDMAILPA